MSMVNIAQEAQLRNYSQMTVQIDSEFGIVWINQNPKPRPCYNITLVEELRNLQMMIEANNGYLPCKGTNVRIDYLVLDSVTEGVFSMGGDLNLFRDHVIRKDKEGLLKYAKACIDTMHGFIVGCRLPITTIALVRGDAMGGGFEVALSCHVLIAEKTVGMGFPEVLFNIFPGMGGYHLLSQRLPQKQVEKMMLSGHKYPAEDLYNMGVVDRLVEKGDAANEVYNFIKACNKHRKGYLAMKTIKEKVNKISYEELMEVCKYWVDVTMDVSERDLKLMERLVRTQTKLANVDSDQNKMMSIAS